MAIQKGSIQFTGRVGNVVGYKTRSAAVGGSTSGEYQLRQLQTEVANPQTVRQMDQRIKMLPAVLFRRQLAGIVNHSFEGVRYDAPSLNYFMQQALLKDSGIPFIPKASTNPVPGAYLVSKGSLAPISADWNGDVNAGVRLYIGHGDPNSEFGTWLEVSNAILADTSNSLTLKQGYQLTFIAVMTVGEQYVYSYNRLVLGEDNESIVFDAPYFEFADGVRLYWGASSEFLILNHRNYDIAAGCVIVSAPVGNTWRRSTQRMVLSTDIINTYMTNAAASAAIESYKKKDSALTSDRYLNDGDDSGSSSEALEIAAYTLSGLTGDRATLNSRQVKVQATADGTPKRVFVKSGDGVDGGALLDYNTGATLEYNMSGGDVAYLRPADVPALAALPKISQG